MHVCVCVYVIFCRRSKERKKYFKMYHSNEKNPERSLESRNLG